MIAEDFVEKFAQAIAKAEGFYETNPALIPTVPQRAHNPGDLTDDGDIGLGVIQTSGPAGAKITVYASDEDGWKALRHKLTRMLNGASHTFTLDLTLMETALKYSGSADWAFNVAEALGVDTRMTLAELATDNQENA